MKNFYAEQLEELQWVGTQDRGEKLHTAVNAPVNSNILSGFAPTPLDAVNVKFYSLSVGLESITSSILSSVSSQ